MSQPEFPIPADAAEATVAHAVSAWVAGWAEEALRLPTGSLGPESILVELGLDSVEGAHLMARLEAGVGVPLEPELPFLFQSIRELAQEVARRRAARAG